MTVGERMKERRKQIDLSAEDVAAALGVSPSTIYRYENGDIERMGIDKLAPIAEALRTTPAHLMGWDDPEQTDSASKLAPTNIHRIETKKFPLLGNIACGEPVFAEESFEAYVETGADIKADFCLRAQGDSMTGARIYDGDIVFIRQQPTVEDGEIAAVIIEDEATLKRVQYNREDNEILLFAENPKYRTMRYAGEQLDHIRIIGKAVAFQADVR